MRKNSKLSKDKNTFIGNFSISDKSKLNAYFSDLFFEYYPDQEHPYVLSLNGGKSLSNDTIEEYIAAIKWANELGLLDTGDKIGRKTI